MGGAERAAGTWVASSGAARSKTFAKRPVSNSRGGNDGNASGRTAGGIAAAAPASASAPASAERADAAADGRALAERSDAPPALASSAVAAPCDGARGGASLRGVSLAAAAIGGAPAEESEDCSSWGRPEAGCRGHGKLPRYRGGRMGPRRQTGWAARPTSWEAVFTMKRRDGLSRKDNHPDA